MASENSNNKSRFYYIIAGVGAVLFFSTFFLSFPLAITGMIGIVGFSILLSFTALGFLMIAFGLAAGSLNEQRSAPSNSNNVLNESVKLPNTKTVTTLDTPANTESANKRERDAREARSKQETAMLAKYSDVAAVMNVRLSTLSLRFWQNNANSIPSLLASNLAREGDKNYETNSRFAPSCTVAVKVAMVLADTKNYEVKSEIIAELQKLDLNNFTQEDKNRLTNTLNRGEELLKHYDEVTRSNVRAFMEHLDQTPWSST